MVLRLEQRSDGRQNDDSEDGQDDACPCVPGGHDGLDHGGRFGALRLSLQTGKSLSAVALRAQNVCYAVLLVRSSRVGVCA